MAKNYLLAGTSRFNDSPEWHVTYYQMMKDGKYWWTANPMYARRFEFDEILNFIRERCDMTWGGFAVVRIEDCTFEKMEQDEELVREYSKLDWAFASL